MSAQINTFLLYALDNTIITIHLKKLVILIDIIS